HGRIERTYQNVYSRFFIRDANRKVEEYVRSCDRCFRNKTPLHQQYGELKWIQPPTQPWGLINLDFFVKLPEAVQEGRSYLVDSVLVSVCKTTRLARFILGREDWNADQWATAF
ncbi:hypothetical protein BJ508DRAFT_183820, partial [Ascobolus immersus RN42]